MTALYKANPDFVRPRHRYNEALSFIEQGLEDISISRATLKWGIGVPWDGSQVIYVWVDALINYLSALHYAPGRGSGRPLLAADLSPHGAGHPQVPRHHLARASDVGGIPLPEHLFVHGYLKLGGEKMSKTRGNVMDPFPLIEQYGADPFRFYCLREVSFGQDGVVSEEGFKARYNTELANDLGNLLSRTTSMIGKYRGGAVPAPPPARTPSDSPLAAEAAATAENVRGRLEELDLSAALETAWTFVRRLNRYVEEQAPWKLAKAAAAEALRRRRPRRPAPRRQRPRTPLSTAPSGTWPKGCVCSRSSCTPSFPRRPRPYGRAWAPPSAAEETSGAPSGPDPSWDEARWGLLPDGLTVVTGSPLFPRIED